MSDSIRKIGNKTELDRILNKHFTTRVRTGYIEVGEDNVCLPIYYKDYEERIRKFEVRGDDVFLVGLPKSGTTWCIEMIWLLVNNLDYEGAKQLAALRCPTLETAALYDFNIMKLDEMDGENPLTFVEKLKSPRCIKSHLHWSLLPEQIRDGSQQPKIISIFRDPKDTCVSHYHQAKLGSGYRGTFEEFSALYLGGRVTFGPFWKHLLSFWKKRDQPNILFVKYEDMKADLNSVIKKVANFLDKSLTEAQIEKLADYLSLTSMKKNAAINSKEMYKTWNEKYNLTTAENDFIRDGKVGDYATLMSPEISAKFDAWTAENLMGTNFSF